MTRFLMLFSAFLLLPAPLLADKAPPLAADYQAEQVAEGVYVIHGPLGVPSAGNQGFMNNPAFVVTGAGVVVIDPGSSVQGR